ncbi:HAD hydrolase-like protein [Pseudomonas syringae]|nr:HAD hydrolase-like protein [Pseudomonas syringae]
MTIHNYEAISFDCFGTLVDWESGIINAIRKSCHDNCHAMTDEELIERFLAHETAILSEKPDIPYRVALAKTYQSILADAGVPCSQEHSSNFGKSIQEWPLFPDTIEALSYLGNHHKLVILSNIDDDSIEITKKRLQCEFFRTYTAQAIGTFKPAINNFMYLIDNLAPFSIRKEKILHVSVSRFHDIEPASSQGIDTAWINRANTLNGTLSIHPEFMPTQAPTYQFSSLSELAAYHQKSNPQKCDV